MGYFLLHNVYILQNGSLFKYKLGRLPTFITIFIYYIMGTSYKMGRLFTKWTLAD